MSGEEALKSTDVTVKKKVRSVVKGQITSAVNKLGVLLDVKSEGDFDHEKISRSETKETLEKLKKSFQLFKKLHDQVLQLSVESKDDQEDEKVILQEENYAEEVSSKVYPVFDKIVKYEKSFSKHEAKAEKIEQDALIEQQKSTSEALAKQQRLLSESLVKEEKVQAKQQLIAKIPEMEKTLAEAGIKYQASKDTALEVVKCLEAIPTDELMDSVEVLLQPADSAKEDLEKSFDDVQMKATELVAALEANGDDSNVIITKVKFNYYEELKEVNKLKIGLDKILNIQRMSDKNRSVDRTPLLSSTFREHSSSPSPIKLNKPDPIKFSGQPRDFATFKRKFEAIIVPNRSAADIGLYLNQAVPVKHQHLISNVDVENYTEMMKILAKKFGTSRLIVESVVSEVDKLKVVTSDKMFLEFVEKLERLNKDLETVNLVDQVANATVIGKLESKLPPVVEQEWIKRVIYEDLDDGSFKEKFEDFMKFLQKHKDMVEY